VTEPGQPLRRLGMPQAVVVAVGHRGVPATIRSVAVDTVAEEWVVEDRWWTDEPLRRRYFELVLVDGRNVVVFRDATGGGWWAQRV
jgi:hypothetical protein